MNSIFQALYKQWLIPERVVKKRCAAFAFVIIALDYH